MTYTIIQAKDGQWKIKEKRYFTTIAKVNGTYNDALEKLKEIKAEDKKKSDENKQKKAEIKKAAAEYEIEFTMNGNAFKVGKTKSGKQFVLDGNTGLTKRSLKCFTLTIEGKGCIFTSGTLEAAVEYIMNN